MSQEHKYVTLRVQVRLLRKGVNAYVASFVFFKMDNLSWALKDEFWEQRPFSKSQVQRFLSLHWLHFLPSTILNNNNKLPVIPTRGRAEELQ